MMMLPIFLVVFSGVVVQGAIPRNFQNHHQTAALGAISIPHLGNQEALKVILQEKLDAFHMKLVKSVFTDVGEWIQYFENFITAKILDHEMLIQGQVADLGSMFENTLKLFGKTVSKYDATLTLLQQSSEKIWNYQEKYETRCARKSTTDRTPRHRHRQHHQPELAQQQPESLSSVSANGAEFVEASNDYDDAPPPYFNATTATTEKNIYVQTTTTTDLTTMSDEVKAEIRQWLKPLFVLG